MKIVLDSNVLLVAIGKRSRFAAPGAAELVMEILIESPNAEVRRIHYAWNVITQDPDDNKFFDAAVAGNADYLVTNDTHFNEALKISFPRVHIISADDFLEIIAFDRIKGE